MHKTRTQTQEYTCEANKDGSAGMEEGEFSGKSSHSENSVCALFDRPGALWMQVQVKECCQVCGS